jgi:hypothetical protein
MMQFRTLARERLPEPIDVGGFTLDEVVTAVTWTAEEGVQIGPDQFDEFAISVGPLPEPGDYPLPAEQIYSDGEVVAWADGPDADLPAPVLTVADDGADEQAGDGHDAAGNTTTNGSDALARGLGIGGLALGVIGLGVGEAILRRSRA